jgi:hypothetical protein
MRNNINNSNGSTQSFMVADAVSVGGYQLHMFDTEPMIQDLHLADKLGYDRPRKIRDLIKRMLEKGQLRPEQVRPTVGRLPNGTVSTVYHLDEHACIKVITRSDTALADKITDEVLDVFIEAREGKRSKPDLLSEYSRLMIEMVMINPPTPGYYSILKASYEMLLAFVHAGLPFNEHNLALISIGQFWKRHYDENGLSNFYGKPCKLKQCYPEAFPQAVMNDHKEVWHYPTSSLEAFERWMLMEYLPRHYPNYLARKVKLGHLTSITRTGLIEAVNDRFLLVSA